MGRAKLFRSGFHSMCNLIEAFSGRFRTEDANGRNHEQIARGNRDQNANSPKISEDEGGQKSREPRTNPTERINQPTGCRPNRGGK